MTETTIPDLLAPAVPALTAEEPIAEAVARELLAPITAPPDPTATDPRRLPAPAATAGPSSQPLDAPSAAGEETTAEPAAEQRGLAFLDKDETCPESPARELHSAAIGLEAASGADAGQHRAPAPPVTGELCVGADLRKSPAATEYLLTADHSVASGTEERNVLGTTALPAPGTSHGAADPQELRAPAATVSASARETVAEATVRGLRAPAATVSASACETVAEATVRGLRAPAATVSASTRETVAEATVRGLRDPAATALVAARRAIADPGCRAPMLRTVLSADLVTLVPICEANPGRTEGGHRAVFPFGDGQAFVARRRWVAFAEPELAQASAFLELLAAAEQNLAGPVLLDRPDGAAVVLRVGTPRDTDAIGAVHLRCSAKTLFNRYHTGLRSVPRKWLHRLLMPPRGTSLLAVCGHDVIGFGQLISQLDGTAEVSLLVEDAWQGQGIGTALLARLVALAEAGGTTELTAVRLPSNDAMVRTAVRAGLQVETSPDDSTVLRLVVPGTSRTVSGSRTSLCPAPRAAPASSGRE
ncbi:hypothetical protein CU254_09525 [Amycolatopsis sp. AA4]|nr:hypothetical protein CU254_09525 [Amycolatopsis sp. AA4]